MRSAAGEVYAIPRVNGLDFSQDMLLRQTAADPLGIRQMVPIPTQPQPANDTRVISDFDPERMYPDAIGGYGDIGDGTLVAAGPTRNLIRVAPGGVRPRTVNGVEVLEPFPAMVNGVSVNVRAERAFQGAAELLGMGTLNRDLTLLAPLMSDQEQQATIGRLKSTLQGKLGLARALPSPYDLGASTSLTPGPDGRLREGYDNRDLIDRYSDAVTKVELMRRGEAKSNLISKP